jgi:hypothetical protein
VPGTEASGLTASLGGQTALGTEVDCPPRRSDRHPRWSDCHALRRYFIDFDRAPRSAHGFGRAPRGTHDSTRATSSPDIYNSGRATRGIDVPALPTTLLVSPSGCVGATGTASTIAVAAGEGRTGGTSGQPSFDDHAGEAELPATGRQTHPVSHFGINLVASALLHPRHPRRSKLAPRHGRRICCLNRQQHLGSCPSPRWLQRHHRQIDFQAQVQF